MKKKTLVTLFSLCSIMIMGLLVGIGVFNTQTQSIINGNLNSKKVLTISLSYANNNGSAINPDNVSIVTNANKTKFKIVGPTPIINAGIVLNLSELTNSSGSEFYYFASNSKVKDTTNYVDPGTTYYLSPYSLEEIDSSEYACGEGLQNMTASKATDLSQYTAKEVWYDMPDEPTTIYATFLTPNNTTGDALDGADENIVLSHSVTTLSDSAFKNSAEITNCVIPSSVTSLPTSTFYGCTNLTNVEIPNTVNLIDTYVFENCSSLTGITIPDGLDSISNYAFYGCTSLTDITIPESVTSIEFYAFAGCTGLSSIIIPNSVTSIGASAFYNCSALKSIAIGSGVMSIGDNAFRGCSGLESIEVSTDNTEFHSTGNCLIETASKILLLGCKKSVIPTDGSVAIIGSTAFYGCDDLTTITIPDSVTSIGGGAFYQCYKLVEVYNLSNLNIIVGSNNNGGVGYYAKVVYTSLSDEPTVKEIDGFQYMIFDGDYYLLGYIGDLTDLVLPENLEGNNYSIYKFAFYEDHDITSVVIPRRVISIEAETFYNCTNLTSITIGDNASIDENLTTIGNYAFSSCKSLETVTIGASVATIGEYAFESCTSLLGITLPSGITSIGKYAFYNCTGLISVIIGNNRVAAETLTSVGNYAFASCTSLKNATLGVGVATIGEYVFNSCSNLTNVTLGSNITTIGRSAFNNCNKLTKVNISDLSKWCNISFSSETANPLYYAHNLYLNNTLVTDLVIPSDVTSIGSYAFDYCTSITSVTIPDSVTSIGSYAFNNCNKLTKVNISDLSKWCNISFSDSYSNPLYFAHKLYLDNELVTDLVIPSDVTSIGYNAFNYCTSITSVTIPDNVASIGSGAFANCSYLTQVNISDLSKWCNISFSNETANPLYHAHKLYLDNELVTDLVIPSDVTSIGSYAFRYCTSITSVTISDNVTSIGSYAFSSCRITDLVIPDSVTSMGDYVFGYCNSLARATIGNGLTTIPSGAFYYCNNLLSVAMGISVKNIYSSAFYNCSKLTDVYYDGSQSQWNAISISYNNTPLNNATKHFLYGWTFVEEVAPTCTTEGYKVYEKDGVTKSVPTLPALGHDCDEKGLCLRCGETFDYLISKTSGASYEFVIESGGIYTSNNKGVHGSTASSTLTAINDCEITIAWTVSSESGCDRLTITVNGTTKVNAVSGSQSGNFTVTLSAGDTIEFKYTKDGSVDKGSDCGTFQIS